MADYSKNIRETLIIGPECQEHFLPLSRLEYLRKHGVCFAGTSILRGEYEIRRKTNNAHLVHYTLRGQGWLKRGGKKTVLKPGQVWISAEGTPQEYGLKGEMWEILWFDLVNQPPWTIISEIGTRVRQSGMGKRFQEVMNSLIWESQTNHMHAERIIQLCSEMTLSYLEREFAVEYDEDEYIVTNKLHNLFFYRVKAQVRSPWSVGRLAEQSGLYVSPTHFSRLCVQHLNISPMKMVTKLRMERAVELLHSSNFPIQQIAELVGYENYFAFSTAFKRWSGSSPREFRKKLSL